MNQYIAEYYNNPRQLSGAMNWVSYPKYSFKAVDDEQALRLLSQHVSQLCEDLNPCYFHALFVGDAVTSAIQVAVGADSLERIFLSKLEEDIAAAEFEYLENGIGNTMLG